MIEQLLSLIMLVWYSSKKSANSGAYVTLQFSSGIGSSVVSRWIRATPDWKCALRRLKYALDSGDDVHSTSHALIHQIQDASQGLTCRTPRRLEVGRLEFKGQPQHHLQSQASEWHEQPARCYKHERYDISTVCFQQQWRKFGAHCGYWPRSLY